MTGHIRKRSPDSFEIRYSLGVDPATGKRKVVTATVRGKRTDAERELRRRLHALDLGEHVDPNRMTVRAWLRLWLDTVQHEVEPKSFERYGELVEGFLCPAFGYLLLTKLSPSHIQRVYNEWAIGGRRDGQEGGLSPRTRRHLHRLLKAAVARAVEQQLLARNPADAIKKLPKVERHQLVTLDVPQSQVLLAAIRNTRIYVATLLALSTGMRRGEICGLRWRNVDLGDGVVRVVESLEQTRAGVRAKAPKTDKGRAITLPSFAIEELRRFKVRQAEELLGLGVRQTGDTLVCARWDGQPLQPRSLTHEFTRLVGRIKDLPRVRFHDLRHSHATQLLLAGVHPKIAQERLGHSTITTTLDLYSHVTKTMQEDAAVKLDAAFRSVAAAERR